MIRCSKCGFPNTRPGIFFTDGVCGACVNYEKRKNVNWADRYKILRDLCDRFRGKTQYDCLIPVSGGKDSYRLVHELVKVLGMNPILCTVTDSFTHTKAGTHNLRNLITMFNLNHWQYTISHDLFKRATRAAFEDTGEALKFVEYAIYTMPFSLAQQMRIPLVVFGENSKYEYGSTGNDDYYANADIQAMVQKIEVERPWWTKRGITDQELNSVIPASRTEILSRPIVAYMSYFLPWSSTDNLKIAKGYGFHDLGGEWDRQGTIENFEQIDSVAYMVHLWLKYPKFGFQRVSDIACRRVREGLLTLEQAQTLIEEKDPVLDPRSKQDFCQAMGYTEDEFGKIVEKHRRLA